MAEIKDTKNFDKLKRQARTLSCMGNLVRFIIIATIPAAFATVIYICTVGAVLPWKVEPIKGWVAQIIPPPPGEASTETPETVIAETTVVATPAAPLPIPTAPPPDEKEIPLPENPAAKIDNTAELLTSQIIAARDKLDEATRNRDLLQRKLKSAESWMPGAESQVNRALAEFNTAQAAYNDRANNGVQRGLDDALRRIQIDVDRAKRHQDEAAANFVQKKAAIDAVQKSLEDSAKILDEHRKKLTALCKKAAEVTAEANK